MSSQVHGIVEDSGENQRVAVATANEEVPRTVGLASGDSGTAVREVPGKEALTEFLAP